MNSAYMPASKSDNWATPSELWNRLDEVHNFDLDAAASQSNHLCANWYGLDHEKELRRDALAINWEGKRVYVNPPYGRVIYAWIKKAFEHSINGRGRVVMLLPARTDTKWFHDYAVKGKVEFLKGRLKFGGSLQSAPFPSILVTFDTPSDLRL